MALLNHFTHNIPNHTFKLNEANSIQVFVCNACGTPGIGAHYACSSCPFTLHRQCAHCPNETPTPFFMHAAHPLVLRHRPTIGIVSCDVCQEPIRGIFYRCGSGCDFDVHPLCRLLPKDVQGVPAHRSDHRLCCVLDGHRTSCCAVCEEPCELWRYRCISGCQVDVHLECIGETTVDSYGDVRVRSLGRGGGSKRKRLLEVLSMLASLGGIGNFLLEVGQLM